MSEDWNRVNYTYSVPVVCPEHNHGATNPIKGQISNRFIGDVQKNHKLFTQCVVVNTVNHFHYVMAVVSILKFTVITGPFVDIDLPLKIKQQQDNCEIKDQHSETGAAKLCDKCGWST